jgi:hypothetical protein
MFIERYQMLVMISHLDGRGSLVDYCMAPGQSLLAESVYGNIL